jgi:hypothetical protein
MALNTDDLQTFIELIRSADVKYYLVQNDLDFSLYRDIVRFKKLDFL